MNSAGSRRYLALILIPLMGLLLAIGFLTVLNPAISVFASAAGPGATYHVNAATGDNSRTLAQAQNSATPWKTITHAVGTVPAGVAGAPNTIQVAAGTYDSALGETFPIAINRAHVSLVGAGAGSTIIEGGGTSDILLVAQDGIQIEGFTLQNARNSGIWSTVSGLTVTRNSFLKTDIGVLVDINEDHNGGVHSFPDLFVISNTLVVTDSAIYYDFDLENNEVPAAADITVGEVQILSNTIAFAAGESGTYGIYHSANVRDLMDGMYAAGDVRIAYNQVNGTYDDGIYVDGGADNITDTTITAGTLNILHNTLRDGAAGDTSIEFYYYVFLTQFHGQATAQIGDVAIRGNTITNAAYGIYGYQIDAEYFYDESSLVVGDYTIEDNLIDGYTDDGIALYMEDIDDFQDSATAHVGTVRIQDNRVLNGDDGINHSGGIQEHSGSTQVTVAPVYIQRNVVQGGGVGIGVSRDSSDLSGSSSYTLGATYIQNNEIVVADLGLDFRYQIFGQSVGDNTALSTGPVHILNNSIVTTGTKAIQIVFDRAVQDVYDNASIQFGDINIQANHLTGVTSSISLDYDPGDVYQTISATAVVTMPTIAIVNNVLTEADTGVNVLMVGNGAVNLVHNTIAGPTLSPGAGVAVFTGTVHMTNTIIAGYTTGISNTGNADYAGGIVSEDYTLFSGNTTNIVGPVTSGGSSMVGDPKFVDPAGGDYHLLPSSDAIDAGVDAGVTKDLDGLPRPIGPDFDIGAYEFGYPVFLPIVLR